MKRHIPLVLLAFVLCLSGCAGRPDLPTSATEDTPQAARWLTLGQSKKDHRNSIKILVVERDNPNKNYVCFIGGFALMLDIQKIRA